MVVLLKEEFFLKLVKNGYQLNNYKSGYNLNDNVKIGAREIFTHLPRN